MQLRQIGLSDEERAGMQGELLRRVGKRRPDLEAFSAWLDARPAFDVLLDGPNIAYHNQNYEGGRFRFGQIAAMVALLRSRGERVLVMLPQAYVQAETPNLTRTRTRTLTRTRTRTLSLPVKLTIPYTHTSLSPLSTSMQ